MSCNHEKESSDKLSSFYFLFVMMTIYVTIHMCYTVYVYIYAFIYSYSSFRQFSDISNHATVFKSLNIFKLICLIKISINIWFWFSSESIFTAHNTIQTNVSPKIGVVSSQQIVVSFTPHFWKNGILKKWNENCDISWMFVEEMILTLSGTLGKVYLSVVLMHW